MYSVSLSNKPLSSWVPSELLSTKFIFVPGNLKRKNKYPVFLYSPTLFLTHAYVIFSCCMFLRKYPTKYNAFSIDVSYLSVGEAHFLRGTSSSLYKLTLNSLFQTTGISTESHVEPI